MARYFAFYFVFALIFSQLLLGSALGQVTRIDFDDKRPNVLLIVADDMGYSDLGSFGSEISTPNLDLLAKGGVRLTNFHAAPSCSPTRAMLMSGCDNHTAGLGAMLEEIEDSQKDKPGYETYLNDRVASLPEILKSSGYHTYMTGKWHLGLDEEHSPTARGFENCFSLLVGAGSHYDIVATIGDPDVATPYWEDGKKIEELPENYYSTEHFTTKMMDYIESNRADGKPFFGWLAYTAPHWPLQAPDEFLEKYKGVYDNGFDAVRKDRLKRAQELGMLPAGFNEEAFFTVGEKWETFSADERRIMAKKMEIYSAMIDCMDHHIGRILEYLEKTGELDNTYVIFMSDNGADAGDVDRPGSPFTNYIENYANNDFENYGKAKSFLSKGRYWAQACTAPFKLWKGFTTEGGIRVPAIIYHPKNIQLKRQGAIDGQLLTVMDVAPTILEMAETPHPGTQFEGREVAPIQGKSFVSVGANANRVHPEDEALGWELHGRRALFLGDWKGVLHGRPYGENKWEIFNLKEDPQETNDLAQTRPDMLEKISKAWDEYAAKRGVDIIEDLPPGGGKKGGKGGKKVAKAVKARAEKVKVAKAKAEKVRAKVTPKRAPIWEPNLRVLGSQTRLSKGSAGRVKLNHVKFQANHKLRQAKGDPRKPTSAGSHCSRHWTPTAISKSLMQK